MSSNLYQYDGGDKTSASRIHALAVGYMLLLYMAVLAVEPLVVIPYVFKDSWSYPIHLVCFLYCMINIGCYYYAVVVCDVSCVKNLQSPRHGLKSGSFYCQSCQQNSPPRSHHCGLCGTCVERRDHHCYFIANCIGQYNLRYFIVLNIWTGFLAIYCLLINLIYLHHTSLPLTPITVEGIVQLIPMVTVYKFWIGTIASFPLTIVIVTWMTFVQILASLGCGGFQTRLLVTGQTTYEFSHHVLDYDHGWQNNFKDVCGKWWYVTWLFPVCPRWFGKVEGGNERNDWVEMEDYPRKVI